jgi:large subunit ribosomal protein L6
MSRLAKKPIEIPQNTEVTNASGVVTVKGPLGTLSKTFKDDVSIEVADGKVQVAPAKKSLFAKAYIGTVASHIINMVEGVNKPYEKKLVVEGVGFKADVQGKQLVMALGFSHPVNVDIPEGLTVTAEKNQITVSGIDKEMVGEFTASVRAMKKPEPYKGKGIRYIDEVIRRKQGKKAV